MRAKSYALNIAVAGILAAAISITSPLSAAENSDASAAGEDSDVIREIISCLTAGQEAVLLRQKVKCKEYRDGVTFLRNEYRDMPLNIDADQICAKSEDKAKDWRRLSKNAIKTIVAQMRSSENARGIRVFGAAFCEKLDLAGLDLPYTLVLDNSLFLDGFEARNFHTRGDLSLDGSLILGTALITRSRIDGSVFGNRAYIKQLRVLDSEVKGSLIFRNSIVPEPAIFDTISLSGELSVRGTDLSYLLLQFSRVGGVLDLTDSQARCAYVIRKSEIGDFVAAEAGFGTSIQTFGEHFPRLNLLDWRRRANIPDSDSVNGMPHSTLAANSRECHYWNIALPGSFLVSDIHVRSSLCLRSFHWLVPARSGQEWSFVTFNDVEVGATSFIDLAPANEAIDASEFPGGAQKRKFEAVGIKTGSLIFNFDPLAQVHDMSVGGLLFQQVYTTAVAACTYDPNFYQPSSKMAEIRLDNVSDPRSQLRLPQVTEIMAWLDKNCLQTTQPLSAFVDAAKKAGDIIEAKQLQIARETKELSLRFQHLKNIFLGTPSTPACRDEPEPATGQSLSSVGGVLSIVNDIAEVAFGEIFLLVADHGYRPQKVIWYVAGTLLVALAYFWFWVRVVAFMPAKQDTIRPIFLLFLFDRLLPAYHISEKHYNIESYYKLAFKSRKNGLSGTVYRRYLNFLGFRIPVVRADESEVRHVEGFLDLIKAIGLFLAIFLVAAINALVNH